MDPGLLRLHLGVGNRVARRMGIEEAILDAGYDVQCVRAIGPDGAAKADLGVDVFRRMTGIVTQLAG